MKKSIFKALMIIVIIILVAVFVQIAWAKYITSSKGNASADIARWSFNVKVGGTDKLEINLANTRYYNDTESVDRSTVAPGTSGEIRLDINANITDVSLKYDIDIDITQVPQNLVFYYDGTMKNAMYHSDNNIHIEGFFECNESIKSEEKILYWKWDMETGQTEEQISNNDVLDSNFMGRDITIGIQVVGSQVRNVPNNQEVQVTLDTNGGIIEGYGNSEMITKILKQEEEYGDLPIPVKEGYTFAGWSGKNLLTLSDRSIRNPGGQFSNLSARNFTGKGIYVGITCNNYFSQLNDDIFSIDSINNNITVTAGGSGYGVGFDIKISPDTEYTISTSPLSEPVIRMGQYREDGTFIKWESTSFTDNTKLTFKTDKEAFWILLVVVKDVSHLSSNTAYNYQIERNSTSTPFEPYVCIEETTTIYEQEKCMLTARWIKE